MGRAGLLLTALGLALLAAALGLAAGNRAEDSRAGAASASLLSIRETDAPYQETVAEASDAGDGLLGRLTIPRLELELPVLPEWSYDALKTAPCRFSGSAAGGDLVLIAHNYRAHFGPIRRLKPGDPVYFEDAAGTVFAYTVAAVEILQPDEPERITAGTHGLTLVTCTYGGKTRLAVFCDPSEQSAIRANAPSVDKAA